MKIKGSIAIWQHCNAVILRMGEVLDLSVPLCHFMM